MIVVDIMLQKDFYSLLTDLINFILPVINIYLSSIILYKTKEKYQYFQLFISFFYIILLFRYSILEKVDFDLDVFYWFAFESIVFIIYIIDNVKKLKKIKIYE